MLRQIQIATFLIASLSFLLASLTTSPLVFFDYLTALNTY